jgi:hypothetical protein
MRLGHRSAPDNGDNYGSRQLLPAPIIAGVTPEQATRSLFIFWQRP